MPQIQQLPAHIADLIAAGEVVVAFELTKVEKKSQTFDIDCIFSIFAVGPYWNAGLQTMYFRCNIL